MRHPSTCTRRITNACWYLTFYIWTARCWGYTNSAQCITVCTCGWNQYQLDGEHSIECKLTPATRPPSISFCTFRPCDLDLWPFDLKSISVLGRSFPNLSLKILGSFVFELRWRQTHTHTVTQTHAETDADKRFTPATVGVSNKTAYSIRIRIAQLYTSRISVDRSINSLLIISF